MRKMMKKAIALGLIATMSMSAATIVHAEDEVTLRVLNWGNTDEEKIANDAIARFNEENPNVKVEQTCVPVESWSDFIQKWITMCTSGEAPDVISLGLEAVNMAVSNDLLVPLDDIITDDEELTAKKDQYAPSLLEGFTVNDSLYGLPNGTQTMVVYYNKHMFDEAGLEFHRMDGHGISSEKLLRSLPRMVFTDFVSHVLTFSLHRGGQPTMQH